MKSSADKSRETELTSDAKITLDRIKKGEKFINLKF